MMQNEHRNSTSHTHKRRATMLGIHASLKLQDDSLTSVSALRKGVIVKLETLQPKTVKATEEKISLDLLSSDKRVKILHALISFVSNGYFEDFQGYLNRYTDIVNVDFNGSTPLTLAVCYQRQDFVKLLISQGVDANKADSDGDRPLPYAMKTGRYEIAEILRDAGATMK